MASSENQISGKITFHHPWPKGIEWGIAQYTRLLSLGNEWSKRQKYRSDLQRLLATGSHLIVDIGMTTEEANREASKPFWVA